jgi:hypothetical protein
MEQSKNYHLSVNIEGALKQRSLNYFEDKNGNSMSTTRVKDLLRKAAALGKKFFSGDCDNQNSEGRCLGHFTDSQNNL